MRIILGILTVFSLNTLADDGNCKLIIQTTYQANKKRVEVMETTTESREDCWLEARKREVNTDPEEVLKVKATSSWTATEE